MIGEWIAFLLNNFGLVMFILAAFIIIIHRVMVGKRLNEGEIVYRWIALLPLGLTGIYAFILHAFFPQISAENIGWATSPFQYEVAMANLAVGVIGILSFKASFSFRLATVIAATCWLWGDAIGHLIQIFQTGNYSVGNAGSWLWMDILVPLILIFCLIKLRSSKTA